ncbi:hypothetical protein NDU88_000538 [Pleurodeles waltl]|uniref:ribonuclease H n=1 Tax=Pleurodeles waltl TaxID=8319 RepID=A0AAV7KPN3_PLEWA|nr:hypothetical protein NDU88_000538 [Pleurodeles waltl]
MDQIAILMKKGAIEVAPRSQRGTGFYSRFFLIRKKTGDWRPILDLCSLNKYLKKQSFRMISLQDVLRLLNRGDFMTSLDLQDAYFHIPIHPNHRKFLRFKVAGIHYQFRVLPFGLRSAPRVFTKVLAPVAAHLRQLGVQVFPYLDDWLIKARTTSKAARDMETCLSLFGALGLTVNYPKSHLDPTKNITFLGAILDTVHAKATASQDRRKKLRDLAARLSKRKSASVRT